MKKLLLILCVAFSPLGTAAQVYHAGEDSAETAAVKHWEVSVGWIHSNQRVQDNAAISVLQNTQGITARGLYYPWRWLGVGLEGAWMEQKDFLGDNSYDDTRYGFISKWVLTPDTKPVAYLLLGTGMRTQKLKYLNLRQHTKDTWYAQGGLGVEVEIYGGWFVAAEALMMYHGKEIDAFLEQGKRWERILAIRGGVRF